VGQSRVYEASPGAMRLEPGPQGTPDRGTTPPIRSLRSPIARRCPCWPSNYLSTGAA